MKVIETLVDEHERIQKLLTLLQAGEERLAAGQRPPAQFFELGMEVGSDYADKLHHFKEEYLLFGVLALKHEGHLDSMVVRHRSQHDLARDMLAGMGPLLQSYGRGDEGAAGTLQKHLHSYVAAMNAHIRSENEVFFPLAAAALTETEEQVLQDQFARYERSTVPHARGRFEECIREMESLLK